MRTILRSGVILLAFLVCKFRPGLSEPGYTKADLSHFADVMLQEFHSLPTLDFKRQCANPKPDPSKNGFYKYVVNVKKELEKVSWNDPDGYYIRNGYTFYNAWQAVGGWRCHPHLSCLPLPDHAMREADPTNWVIWYECGCGETVVTTPEGGKESYPSVPINPTADPHDIECQYTKDKSYCSAPQQNVRCKEPDHICIMDEFNVACDPENEEKLLDYLNDAGLTRRSGDCRCRPATELESVWGVEHMWSSKHYVLEDKPLARHGEKCANIIGLIQDVREKHQTGSTSYRLPITAKPDFDALRNDPGAAECDAKRELYCDFGTTNPQRSGTCVCNQVPKETGWFADTENKVTTDGHCALKTNSDCSFGLRNHFACHEPEKCLIQVCNVECNQENVDKVHEDSCVRELTWEAKPNFTDSSQQSQLHEERYVKRCHCVKADKVFTTFQERHTVLKGSQKKKPIFDLGYGGNGGGKVKPRHFWMVTLFVPLVFCGVTNILWIP